MLAKSGGVRVSRSFTGRGRATHPTTASMARFPSGARSSRSITSARRPSRASRPAASWARSLTSSISMLNWRSRSGSGRSSQPFSTLSFAPLGPPVGSGVCSPGTSSRRASS
jgi:hypothetical protein